jgi:hypothetical protein
MMDEAKLNNYIHLQPSPSSHSYFSLSTKLFNAGVLNYWPADVSCVVGVHFCNTVSLYNKKTQPKLDINF